MVASGIALSFGCATAPTSDLTTIRVGGPEGSPISGYYVQQGQKVPLSGTLPFTFTHEKLEEFEVLKSAPGQPLQLAAQNDVGAWHSEAFSTASQGIEGLRVIVNHGVAIKKVKP